MVSVFQIVSYTRAVFDAPGHVEYVKVTFTESSRICQRVHARVTCLLIITTRMLV